MDEGHKIFTIPNVISFLRLVASPFMIVAGFQKWEIVFLVIYMAGMFSDFIDGFIARRMHVGSRLGALLDSWGDGALYACAAIGAFILWPERMSGQSTFFLAAGGMVGLSIVVCFLKHGRPPSYHTWTTKTASAAIGITACLLFLDLAIWPFRAALALLGVSALEALCITLLLREWQPDIPTLLHAVRIRKGQVRESVQ